MSQNKYEPVPFENIRKQWMKDPDFAQSYGELQPRYEVIAAMLMAEKEAGLTRKEIAQRMGIKPASLSRMLSGKYPPRWDSLEKFAQAVGKTVELRFE